MSITNTLKGWLPQEFKNFVRRIYSLPKTIKENILISSRSKAYAIALRKAQKKDRITIAFFVVHGSVWKYDLLYNFFEKDIRFNPIVVICPYISYDRTTMLKEMHIAFTLFKDKNYRVIKTYDETTDEWLNVKNVIEPDAIFFTNPYKLTKEEYYITNWLNTLTFYVPYGFMITNRPKMQYDELLHNLVYQVFYETDVQKKIANTHSRNKGCNGIALGYPGLDELLFADKAIHPVSIWKIPDPSYKRIIWAPHHTIEKEETAYNYSNFLKYAEVFLTMVERFNDKIQVAFKPHPILKPKLYQEPQWGKRKTDEYYQKWESLPNGQLSEGEYIELFLTSDAMIHDSGSFLVEYISVNKPSLYMIRNENVISGFTSLGDEVISCHYKSYEENDLFLFVENIVINENDTLQSKREQLIDQYLRPSNDHPASENIYHNISTLFFEH